MSVSHYIKQLAFISYRILKSVAMPHLRQINNSVFCIGVLSIQRLVEVPNRKHKITLVFELVVSKKVIHPRYFTFLE